MESLMSDLKHYELETDGDVLIIIARTSMVDGTSTDLLDDRITLHRYVTDHDISRLVFDFRRASHFSSIVINTLTFLRNTIVEKRGRMAICSLSDIAREVLNISGIDSILDLFPTQGEALAYVQSSPPPSAPSPT